MTRLFWIFAYFIRIRNGAFEIRGVVVGLMRRYAR